jgi:Tol biopolymer transport system component/DNA-binding winged helix-turn-helix (wHTH) protein
MPQWPQGGVIRFGAFEVEPQAGILRKGEARIRLQDQPFQVLLALLEKPGQVISREELHQKVWNGEQFSDLDHRLNVAVNKIREALRDSTETPRFVETLPKRGYRFVATVEDLPNPSPPAVIVHRSYRRFAWIAAGLLSLTAAGLWLTRARAPLPPPRVVPLTTLSGVESFATFSPDGKQVAFNWNGEIRDNFDIYVKVVGDATTLRLTTDPANDSRPAWSPSGRHIAFVSERDGGGIYLVSPVGGPERKLAALGTAAGSRPSWSPDGRFLLVTKRYSDLKPEDGNGALFLIPVESGDLPRQLLTPARGTWYQDAAFAPNGRSLAVVSCTGAPGGPSCSIRITDLKEGLVPAGEPRNITRQTWWMYGLAWMPDASSLVYSGSMVDGLEYLWRVTVRNGKEPERLELAGSGARRPAFDVKGSRLAFNKRSTNSDIWRLGRGGKSTPLLTSSALETTPQFSPDGRRIAFASNRNVQMSLWVANADGTGAAQVSNLRSSWSASPRWSPDGRWLAFDAYEQGRGWDVWVMEANGTSPRQVTHGPTDNVIPSWSADGNSIYFASKRSGRSEIWRISPGGGTAVQITRSGGHTALESPDGKTLYYTLSVDGAEGLYAKKLPDGEEKQVVKERVASRGFAVFADGVYYLYQRGRDNYEIRFHEFAGRGTRVMSEIKGGLWIGLSVSPDRTAFLYSKYIEGETDLMLIENFR